MSIIKNLQSPQWSPEPHIGCQKCNKYKSVMTKYIPVFAPGTLGIYQTLIWSQLAIGLLGDIVLMDQYLMYGFMYLIYGYQIAKIICNGAIK